MKTIIQNIQNNLATIKGLNYVDENWGQLDYYSANMPVKWPCCLIDVNNAGFSNMGVDQAKQPVNRQNAEASVKITVANMKLTNTSFQAPQGQKDAAWSIWDLIEDVHVKLHGFCPERNCGKMIRKTLQRTLRDDGVQEYEIIYHFEARNV
ncbi:hypothetical protein [Flavobacterium aestivum]|uniref:hypothetical protein n=1 Tax=Flavobacterium aestivum TaxID=3003257 RepID=UPI00228575B4|nr:hypothetical protein [Flavobacterium aestivum]